MARSSQLIRVLVDKRISKKTFLCYNRLLDGASLKVKVCPFGNSESLLTDGAKKEADFFMFNFLKLRSPKGGMELRSLRSYPVIREENITIEKPVERTIVNDYLCLKIGYGKAGEPLFIKPSDAHTLYRMLKSELGDK